MPRDLDLGTTSSLHGVRVSVLRCPLFDVMEKKSEKEHRRKDLDRRRREVGGRGSTRDRQCRHYGRRTNGVCESGSSGSG